MNISTDCQSTNSISLTLNKPGIFCHLKARGGIERGISPDKSLTSYIAVFQSNHYFMVSNENLGLQWSIEAIIILLCWILLPWDCSEVTYFVLKICWFWVGKFWKSIIYDLHAQYAHQMKAENIPNANQGLKLQFD